MVYIIIESQKSNNGSVAIVTPASYSDKNIADQMYHAALSAAAVSSVDVHSVAMLDETLKWLKGETYYHGS